MKQTSKAHQPGELSPVTTTPAARILVVDDDALICGLHAAVLELAGYDVLTASDGADALSQLAADHFDLVLTYYLMPCLDGASMILSMRNAGSRIPVVMVSCTSAQVALPPEIAREVCAFLPKPARVTEVLAAVAQALRPGLLAAA
jgi:two-component system OmpR family response regulator